jgi:hypothetical protein
MKKPFLGLLSLLSGCALFSGCGTLNNVMSLATGNSSRSFTFQSLPKTTDDITSLKEADLKDPYGVAALTLLALTRYGDNPDACYEMLNFLKGPEPLSTYEKQFIRERLQGKEYKPFSYFAGSSPDNNYTPSQPYKITVSSNPYSFQEDGWAVMHVTSSGADNPRQIKLRQKKSTGQWFLNDIQCLSDIRTPAKDDKWR